MHFRLLSYWTQYHKGESDNTYNTLHVVKWDVSEYNDSLGKIISNTDFIHCFLEENPYSIRYTTIEICPCSKYTCADNTFGNKEMKVWIYVEYEVLYKNEFCTFLVYRYFHKFGLSQQFFKWLNLQCKFCIGVPYLSTLNLRNRDKWKEYL